MWPLATLGLRPRFCPSPSPKFLLKRLWSHSFAMGLCCTLSYVLHLHGGTCPGRGTPSSTAPFILSSQSHLSGEQPSQPGMAPQSRFQLSAHGPKLLFILLNSNRAPGIACFKELPAGSSLRVFWEHLR